MEIIEDWKNRFKRLGPVMGDDGTLTAGDRISSWLKGNWDKDHLTLLPTDSPFTKLVIRSIHDVNHDGIDTTVAKVRREYWIPHLYRLVKQIRQSCCKCQILDKT